VNCCPLAEGTGEQAYTCRVKKDGAKRRKQRPNNSEGAVIRKIEVAARSLGEKANKGSGMRLGIGDDAALWHPRTGFETVLTSDWFLEGTHFLRNSHAPDSVGWKCLARAISDIAAMGGEPRCFLLSLGLPEDCTKEWLNRFLRGLCRASSKLGCVLAGGDTTRSGTILINISVVGEVKQGCARLRSTARAGDRIFVSGRLGEAELGWRALQGGEKASEARPVLLLHKHLYPEPRIELGRWLAQSRTATAMMDLSDGLSSDLARMCEASGTGARIYSNRLPLPDGVFSTKFSEVDRRTAAIHGGDDYELLFCVAKANASKIPRKSHGVALAEIGEVTNKRGVFLIENSGESHPLRSGGWDPFKK
jgi:thiamine-monophosphate kinase